MHPTLKQWLATLFHSLGLGFSLHLALLKTFSMPCLGGGGCNAIIHSSYGSVLGLPVGYFGAVLWAGAILVPDRAKRALLLGLLAGGSLIFMCIQFLVLEGFCLYCTTHAVASFAALVLNAQEPRRWAAALGILLAFGGFGAARWHAAGKAAAMETGAANPVSASATGLPWLGEITPQSPTLILSLDCPACIDLLEELTRQPYGQVPAGPAILFKVNARNESLTHVFVASVLSSAAPKRESFLASTALLLSIKEQVLSAPATATTQLSAFFPKAAGRLEEARRIVSAQTGALHASKVPDTTPLLIPVNGKPKAFFRPEELFPR